MAASIFWNHLDFGATTIRNLQGALQIELFFKALKQNPRV